MVTSAGLLRSKLKAVTALTTIADLCVGRRCLQVSSKEAEDRSFTQLTVRLNECAHEEGKSRGQRIDTLLNAQVLKPSLHLLDLWILLGLSEWVNWRTGWLAASVLSEASRFGCCDFWLIHFEKASIKACQNCVVALCISTFASSLFNWRWSHSWAWIGIWRTFWSLAFRAVILQAWLWLFLSLLLAPFLETCWLCLYARWGLLLSALSIHILVPGKIKVAHWVKNMMCIHALTSHWAWSTHLILLTLNYMVHSLESPLSLLSIEFFSIKSSDVAQRYIIILTLSFSFLIALLLCNLILRSLIRCWAISGWHFGRLLKTSESHCSWRRRRCPTLLIKRTWMAPNFCLPCLNFLRVSIDSGRQFIFRVCLSWWIFFAPILVFTSWIFVSAWRRLLFILYFDLKHKIEQVKHLILAAILQMSIWQWEGL